GAFLLYFLHRSPGGVRPGGPPGQLRILGAAQPLPAALDRLDHEQIGHRLVVREVADRLGLVVSVAHWANGNQAIGTPAADWSALSVAVIQLSPSGSSTEAGRTRHMLASSTLAGTTPRSR